MISAILCDTGGRILDTVAEQPAQPKGMAMTSEAQSNGSPLQQLIVIGASAGGIDALRTLVSTIPEDLPAPIVIAQHVDPNRLSHLRDILASRTTLDVRSVEARQPLEAGVIYVVPANRDVQISDTHVEISVDEPAADAKSPDTVRPKPSIDHLFSSGAHIFGDRLIAVVLTGLGSDGASGARDVKQAGGTVIIQNPRTALYPAMPLSLAPATVDIVADLETIGPLLHELATAPLAPEEPAESRALRGLLDQLRERSGIDFTGYKSPTIMRRLQRRMVATGQRRITDYAHYVQRIAAEYDRLVSSFLIKVTGFFRDQDLFGHLREVILPQLITDARRSGNELRLWSAGCATGEEAYSLAILVAEVLGDELERFNVRVFATDLDPDAIAFARRGIYPASALTAVPPPLLERFFNEVSERGEFEIVKRVRSLTVFGQHDLGQRAPFPRIDLALCRNVLIYFTTDLQRRALQLFAFALRDGGYLALGKAETISPLAEYFAVADSQLKLYRRQGGRTVAIPAARIRDVSPVASGALLRPASPAGRAGGHLPDPLPAAFTTPPEFGALRPTRLPARVRAGAEQLESVLRQLPVGAAVVNRRYDILAINAAARRLLGIHSPAVGEDLIHLTQGVPADELRAAIDATLRASRARGASDEMNMSDVASDHAPGAGADAGGPQSPEQARVVMPAPASGSAASAAGRDALPLVLEAEVTMGVPHYVQINCGALDLDGADSALALVLVIDVTTIEQDRRQQRQLADQFRRQVEEFAGQHAEEVERSNRQLRRVTELNQQLIDANQDLTESNASLRSANEELLLAHEEAQAATEEVETLNEELQATNEEQETLNEELQATIEELNTTNDDLQARSIELQDIAEVLESERSQLRAVLAAMWDAVLVLDAHGRPVLTNEAYDASFGGVEAPVPPELIAAARERAPFAREFTRTAVDGEERRYEARGRPFQRVNGAGTSIIVTIRELAVGA